MSKYDCNQGGYAVGQVGRGPTTGNGTLGAKRTEFIAEKAAYQASATEITARYGERGRATTGYINKDDDSIHPNTNVGRGPTRGNRA